MEPQSGKGPFFIVGSGRSGSTLLQVLLDAHPNIAIPPESQIYDSFGSVFWTYGDLRDRANRRRFIRALLGDVFIGTWHLNATVNDVEARLKRADRGGIIDALFTLYAERSGAVRWGDKTPEHVSHLAEIIRDFPDARLIHLVRDGRDVAEAFRRMVIGPVSAAGLAGEWRRKVMSWQTFCCEHETANTLMIRYEDLVREPQEAVRGVLEFLGEPYIDTVASYMSTSLSQNIQATEGAWHSSLGKDITTAKIGLYRQKLSRRDIEIFESIAGDALTAYGYERDCELPRPANVRENLWGFFADRTVRWYRKLSHPILIRMAVQPRLRMARRLLPRRSVKRVAISSSR